MAGPTCSRSNRRDGARDRAMVEILIGDRRPPARRAWSASNLERLPGERPAHDNWRPARVHGKGRARTGRSRLAPPVADALEDLPAHQDRARGAGAAGTGQQTGTRPVFFVTSTGKKKSASHNSHLQAVLTRPVRKAFSENRDAAVDAGSAGHTRRGVHPPPHLGPAARHHPSALGPPLPTPPTPSSGGVAAEAGAARPGPRRFWPRPRATCTTRTTSRQLPPPPRAGPGAAPGLARYGPS